MTRDSHSGTLRELRCTLEKEKDLESFQNMRDKYDLSEHEFYRYLQLRDYYRKEIKIDPSMEVNGVIQTIISIFRTLNRDKDY